MLILALLLLAAAALVWPDSRAAGRLRAALREDVPHSAGFGRPAWLGVVPAGVVFGAVLGVLLAGAAGLLAGGALAWSGVRYWRSQQRTRQQWERATAWAAGVRLLVAELRAGAHPAAAAEGAAGDSAPEVARMLRSMAATARLGGDVVATLSAQAGSRSQAGSRTPTARMARAWALAERHGVALAELLDSVRRDVEHRATFAREVDAKMAGPRATAAVLAGLPVLGILLGESAGAAPLRVLTGETAGQVLLVAGTGLLCAGTVWTSRLTRTAVQP